MKKLKSKKNEQKNNFIKIYLRICDFLNEFIEHLIDAGIILSRDIRVVNVVLDSERVPIVVRDRAVEEVALVSDKDGREGGAALPADLAVPQLREVERLLVAAVVHDEAPVGAAQEMGEGEGPSLDVRGEEGL